RYPGTIFCAVETSGDGAANFYSRIQMYMFKARILAEEELARAYEETGVTEAEVRAFLEKNPRYASPLHHAPHRVAGSAANLVYEVGPLIRRSAAERALGEARAAAGKARAIAAAAPAKLAAAAAFLADPETHARARADAALLGDIVRGKAAERFRPLALRLAGKAYFEDNPEVRHVAYSGEPIAAE
ncbi:MAG: 2-hydroxyglutaryl-CoA dehydratase, partial [Polyangiaceae bacterium]|nr:2-hydroxyglutaryl-CoA dehydratase [Polyangiaceae bacterium]